MSTASPCPVPSRANGLAAAAAWIAAGAILILAQFMVVRACGYDFGVVARYAFYFSSHVLLPGVVAMALLKRGPVSLTTAIALGVPTGYAIEVATFLGAASLGIKPVIAFVPVVWLAVAVGLAWRRRASLVRCRWTTSHAGLALALSALSLCTVVAAASQMFAESPLVGGLPQRPIFHDWVYLVSRAAAIKQLWPLEDPSLAGTSLQYHYFMLVHPASASLVTGLPLTTLLLRLMIVPLGFVLVAQAFLLGRRLTRRPWAGVLAAFLTVATSEVSFAPHYGEPMFLGLFVRWLYVSPTFFFGHVFFGALLLVVAQADANRRWSGRHIAWLVLLAAAATGAKGTVLPVLLVALLFYAAARVWSTRRVPWRLLAMIAAMGGAFALVYSWAMSAWGTGAAGFEPLRVLQLTQFWRGNVSTWTRLLDDWLPSSTATAIAAVTCAVLVLAGTAGVRLLAIPYLCRIAPGHRRSLATWLGAVLLASWLMGLSMRLDSYGELYLVLLMRLPMAVLAAGFIAAAWQRLLRTEPAWRASSSASPRAWLGVGAQCIRITGAIGLALTLFVQTGLWVTRNLPGLQAWLHFTPRIQIDADLRPLYEAMAWVREHTEPNAVLIANAFTPANLRDERGAQVNRTSAGLYYYYSALSERKLWVEGPIYSRDAARARRRVERAAALFYHGQPLSTAMVTTSPCYALIDHDLGDGAKIAAAEADRVFTNGRIEIIRLPNATSPARNTLVAVTP